MQEITGHLLIRRLEQKRQNSIYEIREIVLYEQLGNLVIGAVLGVAVGQRKFLESLEAPFFGLEVAGFHVHL
jgi:hypothetical protein